MVGRATADAARLPADQHEMMNDQLAALRQFG
jgi:hypothetical protein